MKKLSLILMLLQLSIFSQDRTTIYNTGSPPVIDEGHGISINQSMATRFTVSNNYVLEAIVFYISFNFTYHNFMFLIYYFLVLQQTMCCTTTNTQPISKSLSSCFMIPQN